MTFVQWMLPREREMRDVFALIFGDSVAVTHATDHEVTASDPRRRLVTLSDVGWVATVDGLPVPLPQRAIQRVCQLYSMWDYDMVLAKSRL